MDPVTLAVAGVVVVGAGGSLLFRRVRQRLALGRHAQLREHRLVAGLEGGDLVWRDAAASAQAGPAIGARIERRGVVVRVTGALLPGRVVSMWCNHVRDREQADGLRGRSDSRLSDRLRDRDPRAGLAALGGLEEALNWIWRELSPGGFGGGTPSASAAAIFDDDDVKSGLLRLLERQGRFLLDDGELVFVLPATGSDEADARAAIDLVGPTVDAMERVAQRLPSATHAPPVTTTAHARRTEALAAHRLRVVEIDAAPAWFDVDDPGAGPRVGLHDDELQCVFPHPPLLRRVAQLWVRRHPPTADLHAGQRVIDGMTLGFAPAAADDAILFDPTTMALLGDLVDRGGRIYNTADDVVCCLPLDRTALEASVRALLEVGHALLHALETATAALPELDQRPGLRETSVSSAGSPFAVRGLDA